MNITHFFTYIQQKTEEKDFSIQISSTLVQADNRNFLIDTGFTNQKEIVYVLNKLGISALDVHYILNTHVHLDHCGGNRYFKNAQIYLSEADYFFQRDFMHTLSETSLDKIESTIKKFFPNFNDKQAALFSPLAKQMANFWEDDIVGNTEQIHYIEKEWPFDFIEAVATPGHSIQHYCFKVHSNPKSFLVTGDALTTRTAFRLNKLDFPYCYDSKEYLRSQKKIGEFVGVIIPGHDKPFDSETKEYLETLDSGNGQTSQDEDELLQQYLK